MSPTSRDQILARIRAATSPSPAPGPGSAPGRGSAPGPGLAPGVGAPAARPDVDEAYAALPRGYLRAHHDPAGHDIAALFAERTADYRAVVERVPSTELPGAIARVLAERTAAVPGPIVTPDGLPESWLGELPTGVALGDTPPLSAAQLDGASGVLTGCAAAVAETGTIILDHGAGQGRRALTLVPDFHLVVVQAGQVAADLADAFARLDPVRPHTLISGPSATSDIELIRVEGVHGPRQLHVLLVPTPESSSH